MLLSNVGAVLAWRGKLEEAERVVAESIRTARRFGDLRSVGNRLITLGGIALALRDDAQARRRFEESLAIHRRLDDSGGSLIRSRSLRSWPTKRTTTARRGGCSQRAS